MLVYEPESLPEANVPLVIFVAFAEIVVALLYAVAAILVAIAAALV